MKRIKIKAKRKKDEKLAALLEELLYTYMKGIDDENKHNARQRARATKRNK